MNYIGNYKDWIDPIWLETILSTPGKPMPNEWLAESEEELAALADVRVGYQPNKASWWFYLKEHLNDADIKPPWCVNDVRYWFIKMEPGQFFPLHKDPILNDRRYWMAMQDYQAGHILIYGDNGEMVKDYKMGDVFEFDASNIVHGAVNISSNVRVVMQISEEL